MCYTNMDKGFNQISSQMLLWALHFIMYNFNHLYNFKECEIFKSCKILLTIQSQIRNLPSGTKIYFCLFAFCVIIRLTQII